MTQTKIEQLVNPEVMADMVSAKLPKMIGSLSNSVDEEFEEGIKRLIVA